MALYSFNASLISRGKGQSIVAADAYICGEKLRDKYEGKIHDRSYRNDVVYKELLLPAGAPNDFRNRQTFMDALKRGGMTPRWPETSNWPCPMSFRWIRKFV